MACVFVVCPDDPTRSSFVTVLKMMCERADLTCEVFTTVPIPPERPSFQFPTKNELPEWISRNYEKGRALQTYWHQLKAYRNDLAEFRARLKQVQIFPLHDPWEWLSDVRNAVGPSYMEINGGIVLKSDSVVVFGPHALRESPHHPNLNIITVPTSQPSFVKMMQSNVLYTALFGYPFSYGRRSLSAIRSYHQAYIQNEERIQRGREEREREYQEAQRRKAEEEAMELERIRQERIAAEEQAERRRQRAERERQRIEREAEERKLEEERAIARRAQMEASRREEENKRLAREAREANKREIERKRTEKRRLREETNRHLAAQEAKKRRIEEEYRERTGLEPVIPRRWKRRSDAPTSVEGLQPLSHT